MGNTQSLQRLRRGAYRFAGWQIVATSFVAAAAGLGGGSHWLLSAFTGGCIGIIAGLYQALRMFSTDASQRPERYMGSVYASEALKIFLTVALFTVAIRSLKVELVPTILGYAATYFVYLLALKTGFPGDTSEDLISPPADDRHD